MPTFGSFDPDKELSIEEMREFSAKWTQFQMSEVPKLQKEIDKFKILFEQLEKEERKPLGMPDDKPKRSSPKE